MLRLAANDENRQRRLREILLQTNTPQTARQLAEVYNSKQIQIIYYPFGTTDVRIKQNPNLGCSTMKFH